MISSGLRILSIHLLSVALAGGATADGQLIERGRQIVTEQCARCHAVTASGASPRMQALPFRDIAKRYPLSHLEEALAEGIITGHNDMPEFKFDPAEIAAMLSYIDSISEP